ncbi:DUF423 domain-containing protein [Snuella lapsa]|uniref:DUF423 domain-containing protein n=1 Tax=Snuella lapsa TaxID=870481 RepID=A0ABP6XP17_9FLAO
MSNKTLLITAALLGLTSVVFGAFGAHGLKALITVEAQQTFETGVRYQMYHALLLLFAGSTSFISNKSKKYIYYLVVVGVLFFSGSIYGLATNALTGFDFRKIALVTPVGGLLLILGWSIMLVDFVKNKL